MSPISLYVSPPCFLTQSLSEPKLTDGLAGSLGALEAACPVPLVPRLQPQVTMLVSLRGSWGSEPGPSYLYNKLFTT